MSIQGIGQYGGFYQNYRTPSIPSITIDEAKQNQAAGQIVNNQQEALQSTQSEESLGLTTSDRNGRYNKSPCENEYRSSGYFAGI